MVAYAQIVGASRTQVPKSLCSSAERNPIRSATRQFGVKAVEDRDSRRPADVVGLELRHELLLRHALANQFGRAIDDRFELHSESLDVGFRQHGTVARYGRVEVELHQLGEHLLPLERAAAAGV